MENETLFNLGTEFIKSAEEYEKIIERIGPVEIQKALGEIITFLEDRDNITNTPKYAVFFAALGYMMAVHYRSRSAIAANAIALGYIFGYDAGKKRVSNSEIDELRRMAGL